MADQKDLDLVAHANIDDASRKLQTLQKQYEQLIALQDRLAKKGANNNFTISSRDQVNLSNAAGNYQASLNDVNSMQQQYGSSIDRSRANYGNTDNIKAAQDVYTKLTSAIEKATSQMGYSPSNGTIRPGDSFNQVQGYRTTSSSAFRTYNNPSSEENRQNSMSEMRSNLRSLSREINNVSRSTSTTAGRVNNTIRSGHITSERYDEYNTNFGTTQDSVKGYHKSVNKSIDDYSARRESLQAEIDSINKSQASGKFSTGSLSSDAAYKAANQSQIDEINKVVDKLKELNNTLDSTDSTISSSKSKLNSSVEGDNATVSKDPYRHSFAGTMKRQMPTIAKGAVASGLASTASLTSSGTQARLQMEDQELPIMYSQAQKNGATKGMDRTINDNLHSISTRNGTGYTNTQMSQFASAYTGSTGNSNYKSGANNWSQLSRYSGMGSQTALGLEQAVGLTGGGSDSSAVTHAIQNEITNSGMTTKANIQGQALTSMLSNGQSVGMTSQNVQDTAAFQGAMAKQGSTLQGQAGAQAYGTLQNTLTNFNDPVARAMFGGNNSKYAGRQGSALLLKDMQDAKSDPTKLGTSMKNALQANGGNKLLAASQISQESGGQISVTQAEHMFNMQKDGDFTKKKLKSYLKSSGSSNENKDAYDLSGVKTINVKDATLQFSGIKLSQAADGARKVGNNVMQNHPYLTALGGGIGGFGLGIMRSGLGIGGSTILNSLFGKTKVGRGASKVLGGATGAIKGSRIFKGASSVLGKGRDLIKGSSILKRGSSILGGAKDAIKGSSFLKRGSSILGGAKDLVKGSSILKGGSKVAAKLGGKGLGKLIPGIGTAWAAYDIAKGVGNVAQHPGDALKHPWLTAGNMLGISESGHTAELKKGHKDTLDKARESEKKDMKAFFSGHKTSSKNSRDHINRTKSGDVLKRSETLLKGYNDMLDKAMKVIAEAKSINGNSSSSDSDITEGKGISKSAADWADNIKKAAKAKGQTVSDAQVKMIESLIQGESGGDSGKDQPGSDPDGDGSGNAKGLLQYKNSTFSHYAVKGHTDIHNGDDQLLAFFNNSKWAKDLAKTGGKAGWAPTGGVVSNATGGVKFHSTGGLNLASQATFANGGSVYGEAGTEAYVPLNAGHYYDGLSTVNDLAGVFGKQLVDNGSKSSSNSNNSISLSPSYNININAGGSNNLDNESIKSMITSALQSYTNDLKTSLNNNFWSNEITR